MVDLDKIWDLEEAEGPQTVATDYQEVGEDQCEEASLDER